MAEIVLGKIEYLDIYSRYKNSYHFYIKPRLKRLRINFSGDFSIRIGDKYRSIHPKIYKSFSSTQENYNYISLCGRSLIKKLKEKHYSDIKISDSKGICKSCLKEMDRLSKVKDELINLKVIQEITKNDRRIR